MNLVPESSAILQVPFNICQCAVHYCLHWIPLPCGCLGISQILLQSSFNNTLHILLCRRICLCLVFLNGIEGVVFHVLLLSRNHLEHIWVLLATHCLGKERSIWNQNWKMISCFSLVSNCFSMTPALWGKCVVRVHDIWSIVTVTQLIYVSEKVHLLIISYSIISNLIISKPNTSSRNNQTLVFKEALILDLFVFNLELASSIFALSAWSCIL